MAQLNEAQIRRYARHVLLPDVGGVGQRRLLDATATFAELTPAAGVALVYLAAAGVGTIVVADEAIVLEGDVGALFESGDVGQPRRAAAAARVAALNPDVAVVARAPGDARPVVVGEGEPLLAGSVAARAWIREAVGPDERTDGRTDATLERGAAERPGAPADGTRAGQR